MSEREYMLTDREILERLPQLIDFSTLTPEQLHVLQMHKQKMDLLMWLLSQEYDQKAILRRQKQTNAPLSDIQQTEMRLIPLRKNVENAQDDIMLFENQHISILQPLIFAGRKAILGAPTTTKQPPEQSPRQKSSEKSPYPLTIPKPQYTYTSAQTKQIVSTPTKTRKKSNKFKVALLILFLLVASTFCYLAVTGYFHEHEWIDADCFSPQTCKTCGETTGEPRNHIWRMPTCTESGFCTQCGQTKGAPLGHEFTSGGTDTPRICKTCGFMRPLSLPQSGQVFIGHDLYRYSQLSITSSTSDSCYIKLKGSSGQDVFSFFVRAGDSVTVDVPAGYYYIYFSYGTDWYGTEYLFGDNTTYAKDDDLLDFENYTWEYTLQPMYGGNFSETPVDAEEFK